MTRPSAAAQCGHLEEDQLRQRRESGSRFVQRILTVLTTRGRARDTVASPRQATRTHTDREDGPAHLWYDAASE
jgi:hypothetical protein